MTKPKTQAEIQYLLKILRRMYEGELCGGDLLKSYPMYSYLSSQEQELRQIELADSDKKAGYTTIQSRVKEVLRELVEYTDFINQEAFAKQSFKIIDNLDVRENNARRIVLSIANTHERYGLEIIVAEEIRLIELCFKFKGTVKNDVSNEDKVGTEITNFIKLGENGLPERPKSYAGSDDRDLGKILTLKTGADESGLRPQYSDDFNKIFETMAKGKNEILYGMELECCMPRKGYYDFMNGAIKEKILDPETHKYLIIPSADGSIRGKSDEVCVEWVTAPLSYQEQKDLWNKIYPKMQECGIRTGETTNGGIHIHVTKDKVNMKELNQLIYGISDKDKTDIFGRGPTGYCYGEPKRSFELKKEYKILEYLESDVVKAKIVEEFKPNRDKYCLVNNCDHPKTIEVRGGNNTVNPLKAIAWMYNGVNIANKGGNK